MKRFKDYSSDIDAHELKKQRLERQMLSWDSSFAEIRDKNKAAEAGEVKTPHMLSWDSSFGETRKNNTTKEAFDFEAADLLCEDSGDPEELPSINPKVQTPGSKQHFTKHVMGIHKHSAQAYNLESQLTGWDNSNRYNAIREKRDQHYQAVSAHIAELEKHYPQQTVYSASEQFGRWGGLIGGDKHPASTIRASAHQHFDKYQLDKRIAGTKPFTQEHAKALLDGIQLHRKNYENRHSLGLGYNSGSHHLHWEGELRNAFQGTYGAHANTIETAHQQGRMKDTKEIFAGYERGNVPSVHATHDTSPKFLGAPTPQIRKSEKPISQWAKERRRHENAPSQQNSKGYSYHTTHEHPDIRPTQLSEEGRQTLEHFTGSGSGAMNGYLRHRAGDPKGNPGYGERQHKNTEDHIARMSANFTAGNTNRRELHTWSGVPQHIGAELMSSPRGASHNIAGFTSTSTSKQTAHEFARGYSLGSGHEEHHIIHYKIKKGAGLSIAHMSGFNENEVVLHHGARIRYHGTTHYKGSGIRHDSEDDRKDVYVHHVTVHPDHIPLSKYGPISPTYDPARKAKKTPTPAQKAETDSLAKELEGHF